MLYSSICFDFEQFFTAFAKEHNHPRTRPNPNRLSWHPNSQTILAKLPFVLHIPIFQSLQPTRLMVILDFSLVMLASFGLQRLIDRKHHSQQWLIGLLSIVFILVWITIISIIKTNNDSEGRGRLD